jgi:uncharacterized protein (DUF433 family)
MRSESVPVSFRLAAGTIARLDAEAKRSHQSRNALTERLVSEGLHTERHPLIRFQAGAAGRRQPMLIGTRLYVHQVIATVRASDANTADAAEYLGISTQLVEAALDYYADYRDEIDADAAQATAIEADELARWQRRQQALT